MTTITRLKQLKAWIAGKLTESRVQPSLAVPGLTHAEAIDYVTTFRALREAEHAGRFAAYNTKIAPKLREKGYAYFLACDSADYVLHQEWCHDNCEDHVLPHYDVWMFDATYPRAFASKDDAMMFKLTFDAQDIEAKE